MTGIKLSQWQPPPLVINKDANNFAHVNGVRLCYLDIGDGVPVLLIHGGGACIETWNHQIEFLSQEFRVLAPDSRGHARSGDTDAPYSHALHASDMVGLMDALGIAKAHVIGWSDGACFGLHMAMHHPDRVASLVMLGGMYSIKHYSTAAMDGILTMRANDYYPYLIDLHRKLSEVSWEQLFEKFRTMWTVEPNHQLSDIQRIEADTLIVLGENDEWGDDRQARELEATIPYCRLVVIPEGAHAVHMTHPEVVNSEILSFLRRQKSFPIA